MNPLGHRRTRQPLNFAGKRYLNLCSASMKNHDVLKASDAFFDHCKKIPQPYIIARPKRGRYVHVSCDLISLPGTWRLTEDAQRAVRALWDEILYPASAARYVFNSPYVGSLSFHQYVPRDRAEAVLERLAAIISGGLEEWARCGVK